jgi:hypothetical protein
MVFPGITHCEYCGERIDIDTGRRCNCLDGKRIIQETKPKLKLIDILNKIANGELKEGTIVKVKGLDGFINEYKFVKNIEFAEGEPQKYDLQDSNGRYVFDEFYLSALEDEVELIEPNDFTDDGKMADNTKIEELDIKKYYIPGLNTKNYDSDKAIIDIIDKFNEVIRKINKGAEE